MYSFSVLLIVFLFHNACPTCVFEDGKYDLSALDWYHGWPVSVPKINGTLARYEISICRPLYASTGCGDSSICLISGNNTVSYGDAIQNGSTKYAIAGSFGGGFSLFVSTSNQCSSSGLYRAVINFVCGPNLGAPELILRSECQANFYWKTSAACSIKPNVKQIPCYVIDEDGNKRDLSPLILQKGGYFINTPDPAIDFVINVCSYIVPDNRTQDCPEGSSACRIIGNEKLLFGSLNRRIQYSKQGLTVSYLSVSSYTRPPHGCRLKPKTNILFKCPNRGRSQPPKLISVSNCLYEVEWETEYACPESVLKGNIKDCKFTAESHGVEIDLNPLKRKSVYNITSNSSSDISFALSVCGGLSNFNCGKMNWKSVSVCMTNSKNGSSEVVGTTDGTNFMYADGGIILTYPKGSFCNTDVQQSSSINFVCDMNAGDGEPRHISSDYCAHIFEWRTKHACLKNPLDTPCSVTFDKKKVNLQKLLLLEGDSWEAIDRRSTPSKDNAEYYLNVCGQVTNLKNLSGCGEGSSACVLLYNGTYLNLGNFTTPPIYDNTSNSVKLHYSGGSLCKNGHAWSSTIEFVCRPGHINSGPVLTRINDADCLYEFEWLTAEACPEGVIEGNDCKVYDSNLEINYDLTSLKAKVYEVDTETSKFYLGVCEPVLNSPCSLNRNSSEVIGVCQVNKTQNTSLKTGEPSSRLSYMDGVVNLTYLSGDPYDDENKTARMTIIIFICDYNSGNSNPYFVEEVDFAYVFHWYTNLVCPHISSVECLAHDPVSHVIYDLSGLSLLNQNWVTIISDNDKERQIYLNVCKSLTRPIGCDSNAAACIVETTDMGEKVVIPNLGQVSGPPILDSPGHLSLTYTNGDPCVAFGENITYSSVIHFLCGDQMSSNGPIFLSKLGACEYTFLWTTKAACPTANLMSKDSCQLTDPDSGYTFDLTSLKMEKQPYIVQTSSHTFQLNICGKITEGCTSFNGKVPSNNVSVCETDNDGNIISELATADSYVLNYAAGQDLTLLYKANSSASNISKEVVIKFPCTTGAPDQNPRFMRNESGQFIFEMKTRLTCIPSEFDCNIVDNAGNEYDLTPLAKFNDGNWETGDHRLGYSHLRYHINFCRPLNKVNSYSCPGGASASCQTTTNQVGTTGLNLGSQYSLPVVSNKGTVVIRYTNGSLCHNGQFSRSTTINLFCSAEERDLKFIGETPECEYLFSLDTPAACPLQSSRGSDCMVKDPIFGYTFDLNPLKSKNNNYNVSVGEYVYSFNVCDKLNGFKNSCENSSACQLKTSDVAFSKSLGLPNDIPIYRKGLITLEYQSGSGSCHGQYNRSTKLTFTCHHGHEDKDGPSYVSEAEDCTYLFEWPTVHACPPFDVIECSVVDENGTFYDFSKLSLLSDNYYVKYPFSDENTFVINVCRSVVHTPDSLCPYTSAICLVDNANPSGPKNLGRVGQPPYIDNGKIKMNYTSGDPCNDEHTNTARFMQTVIEFSCDKHNIDSGPQFVGKDDCTYYFDWPTTYACPEEAISNRNDCTALDPNTNFIYNLTDLKNLGIFNTTVGSHRYYINVCGNNSSSPCGPNTGLCQEEITGEKRHWSGGKSNGELMFTGDGVLYLNYSDGDSCHNDRFKRNTIIEFTCGPDVGEPQFMYEAHDCTYFFSWKTEFACQVSPHCVVKNGSQHIDLTSLTKSYHIAGTSLLNDQASYYISVCSPLPDVKGLFCPPGAGACRVMTNKLSSRRLWQSLGKIEYPPFIDFMGHVTAIYTNGSICLSNPSMKNRARIIFVCDAEAGMGEPVLIDNDYDECLFLFEWKTSNVCPEKPEEDVSTYCNYTDKSKGVHFDLSPLMKKSDYYSVVGDQRVDSIYTLSVCSPIQNTNISICDGTAGVCHRRGNVTANFGTAASQQFSYDGRRLRLSFFDGEDCPSGVKGHRSSEIFFICDPNAGLGQPVLHKRYTCLAVFLWHTALVCQNMQNQCAFEIAGNNYDFNLLTSLSHNWETTDVQNTTTYWINMCRGVQKTNNVMDCPPTAAICMKDHTGSYISLGTIQTMEAKSINSTDILLSFQSGDTRACSKVPSSHPLTPITRIFMRCGKLLGKPKIFSGPDNECFYDFVWETSLACADKAEEVILEENGIIRDNKYGFTLNVKNILDRMFVTNGTSGSDTYVYQINLSGVYENSSNPENPCAHAAICQAKYGETFHRDIGSIETRNFILRGNELHLQFMSLGKPCGKNKSKNVTSIINMQCSTAAGLGNPTFLYESGNCDYLFEWQTSAACPIFHDDETDDGNNDNSNIINPIPNPYQEVKQSSHTTEIVIGVLFAALCVMVIIFFVAKPERRSRAYSRVRNLFCGVKWPYFRYKRFDGERLILVDATQPHNFDDDKDVELLN